MASNFVAFLSGLIGLKKKATCLATVSVLEFVKDRPGHDFRYSVDWSKIRKQTHYEPRVSFLEGLRDTIKWYRENSSWWMALKNS